MNVNSISKQLLFSAVRIEASNSKKDSVGTGFIVNKKLDDNRTIHFLVTNKHVIRQTDDNDKFVAPFTEGKIFGIATKT